MMGIFAQKTKPSRSIGLLILFKLFTVGLNNTYAQANLELRQSNATGTYVATQSIVLKPGFESKGPFLAYIGSSGCQPLASALSQNRNYLAIWMPRIEGITDPSELASSNTCHVMQTVDYFDGLGRPLQSVQVKGNPDATRDIIQPFKYDLFGRESTKYLGYSSAGTPGSYREDALNPMYNNTNSGQAFFFQQINQGYREMEKPISVSVFEPSPLNRIVEQGAPGTVWQPGNGHTQRMAYMLNSAVGDKSVRLYNAIAVTIPGQEHKRILSGTGNYNDNQLFLTITKDENWITGDGKAGTVEEYKDKEGRVVLKKLFNRKADNTIEILSTYYVYDDLGHLSFVLPPGANPDAALVPSQATLDNFCYQYCYDNRNRLIEKKIPGKDWEYMVYNKLDQVVMTQDGVERNKAPQEWLLTKYDAFGKVVYTGVYASMGSSAGQNQRIQMQASVDGQGAQWESRITTGNGYTANTFPVASTILNLSYYDDYAIPGLPSVVPYNQYGNYSTMTKGLQTATLTNVIGTMHYLWSSSYFDNEGRVVKSVQQHYKGGSTVVDNYDEITSSYSFTDEVTASVRKHYVAGTESLYVKNEYKYDHTGRLTDTYQTTGNTGSTINNSAVLLSRNEYNEIGQLKNKKLHSTNQGDSFAQNVNYSYNERGWLSSQSSTLFSQILKYQEAISGVLPQYNGSISRQEWGVGKYYNYKYDKLNRLTTAVSDLGNNEFIDYDVMGNITRLQRRLNNVPTDQMKYSYLNGNRLSSVLDTNTNVSDSRFQLAGTTDYDYDVNGNMTSRSNAINVGHNIAGITYNYMNLPVTMVVGGNSLDYTWDAVGNKIRKQYGSIVNNDYINGIHYENGDFAFVQTGTGRATRNGTGPDPVYLYEYTLSDHLGNGRVYFDINNGMARQIQSTDYYAFGIGIQSASVLGSENKYQYNGKEKQEEMQMLDYGARFYDPVIARWNVIDPLARLYSNSSSYNYVLNNPVNFIDPDGMRVDDWGSQNLTTNYVDQNGKSIVNTNDGIDRTVVVKDTQRKAFDETMEKARGNGTINDRQVNTDISNNIDSENNSIKPLKWFYGTQVFKTRLIEERGGLTLPGIGIFINPKDVKDQDLLRHEFGHILQAKEAGYWDWYTIYAAASLKSGANNGKNGHVHQTTWVEVNANELSSEFFKGLRWNARRFPLVKKPAVIPISSPSFDAIISQIK